MSVMNRVIAKGFGRRGVLGVLNHVRTYSSEDECFKSSLQSVEIPDVHLVEYITENFGTWHDKIAVECGFTGRKYTFDQVRIKATNLNRALRKKLKLQRNDVVAVVLPNLPEFPICVHGILLAGLRVTTVNPIYTTEEIQKQLEDADVKAVITISPVWNNVSAAISNLGKKIPVAIIKQTENELLPQGAINFKELTDEKYDIADPPLPGPHETVFLPYSSGTTGAPKGVELTSHNLLANLVQYGVPELGAAEPPTDTHMDSIPAVLPMFHIYGFSTTVLNSFRVGTKVIALPKFTPESYLKTLAQHKPNVLMIVPPIAIFLYAHPAAKAVYFQNVKAVLCGAAPLGALDEQKFREKVVRPIDVIQGYGLSETSPVVTMLPKTFQGTHKGSIGHPVPNTSIKVVDINDPEGKHLGPNQTGELLVKGPQVMKCYLNKPEETKNTFLNGWLRTGDLVYYNEGGAFYIADRIKELIKVNAFQVPPAELEDIIRDYPGIADAAVIGIPHPTYGEVPRAYVVAKADSKVDSEALMNFVEQKVARHKKLRGGVSIVNSIPKNASGKVLRKDIKQMYQEKGI